MRMRDQKSHKHHSVIRRHLRIKMAHTRLGDLLLARGRISEQDLDRALEQQRNSGKKIGDILLHNHRISRLDLLSALGQQMTMRAVFMAAGLCLVIGGSSIGLARAQQTYSYPPTMVACKAGGGVWILPAQG